MTNCTQGALAKVTKRLLGLEGPGSERQGEEERAKPVKKLQKDLWAGVSSRKTCGWRAARQSWVFAGRSSDQGPEDGGGCTPTCRAGELL